MKPVNVIQIGITHDHATFALNSLLEQPSLFSVAALGLTAGEKENQKQRIHRYPSLKILSAEEALALPGLDAVIVETAEQELTHYAQLAANRNLPVYMDKPGSPDLAAFERLIHTAKEKKLPFMLGYMYRYNPAIQEALKKAKNGKLGEIYAVEAQMNCLHKPEKQEWIQKLPGGMMFFLGCHLVDLILQFQGEPKKILPLNVDATYGMAAFQYQNGISFAKCCDTEPGGFARRQLIICGTEGTLELHPLEAFSDPENNSTVVYTAQRLAMKKKCLEQGWKYNGEYFQSTAHSRYNNMLKEFAAIARGEKQNPYTYDYELTLFKTLLKCCGGIKE